MAHDKVPRTFALVLDLVIGLGLGHKTKAYLWSMVQVSVNRTGPRTKGLVFGPRQGPKDLGPKAYTLGPDPSPEDPANVKPF